MCYIKHLVSMIVAVTFALMLIATDPPYEQSNIVSTSKLYLYPYINIDTGVVFVQLQRNEYEILEPMAAENLFVTPGSSDPVPLNLEYSGGRGTFDFLEGDTITIDLYRNYDDYPELQTEGISYENALGSTVTPISLVFTQIPDADTYRRDDIVEFSWETAGFYDQRQRVHWVCPDSPVVTDDYLFYRKETGNLVLDIAQQLTELDSELDTAAGCDVTVLISAFMEDQGTISSALGGGAFEVERSRSFEFSIAPVE